jgi:tRNA threonylcarbamoyladenosine biosynthesis protein TsaB
MILLAIDTTGPDCAIALRVPGRADVCLTTTIGRGHAERLAPMVEQLLAEQAVEPGQLDRIGVTIGPGSFAGTRVGVAFARGLGFATGADIIGVSNLEILAHAAGPPPTVAVIHDAKRGEVILQMWRDGVAEAPDRLSPDAAAARIRETMGPTARLAGTGGALPAFAEFTDTNCRELDLTDLLDLAAKADPAAATASPFYARPPDAKLPAKT